MRWLLAAAYAVPLFAQIETGVVKASDGGSFHRNTIPQVARLGDGRLLCTFGVNSKDRPADGRIHGIFSADDGRTWGETVTLIDDSAWNDGDANMLVDGNTVFVFGTRTDAPNTIRKTATLVTRSTNNGATWSTPKEIPLTRQYMPGKTHNAIKLSDGSYLMGISWDLWPERGMNARTEGEMVLSTGALLSRDGFKWTLHGDLTTFQPKVTPNSTNGLCEPSVVELASGEILMYLRSGTTHHWESRSADKGVTWSAPKPGPLVGHNTPAALWRVEGSPIIVAVWNHSPINRFPLSAASSRDGGRTWSQPRILDRGEDGLQASYPGLTQAKDGKIVAVWQHQRPDGGRDIRWARFDPQWLGDK